MATATAVEIAAVLDRELNIQAFQDVAHNGLQVDGSRPVERVCCGVDACMDFFRAAHAQGSDFLVCHHGISWGDSLKRITGLNHARLAYLLETGMALYACHLPLDVHPVHGNNARICRALGLRRLRPFGDYHGVLLGFEGELPEAVSLSRFKRQVAGVMGREPQCMDFGPQEVRRIAVVSGGAAEGVLEAGEKGVDVYLTGEPKLEAYAVASELGVNVLFAGHYATEVFGVQALGSFLKKRFKVAVAFIDLKVPY